MRPALRSIGVMGASPASAGADGLSLQPFRAIRPTADGTDLAPLLCPPYDVIDADARRRLLTRSPDNYVAIALPDPTPAGYADAARVLQARVDSGVLAVDPAPALYVYEMASGGGDITRGLVGAVELRAPEDGVILPHENTMANPVADRLAVMTATGADLEPIYLIYDGGGPASALLHDVDSREPIATTRTDDGITHRLWLVDDPAQIQAVRQDLATRRALIADGHHRYATYRERQRLRCAEAGPGPWDFGLALLVDSTQYGPQVHPIHRVVPGLSLARATELLTPYAEVERLPVATNDTLVRALDEIAGRDGFAAVVTDGVSAARVYDSGGLAAASLRAHEPPALADLDVTVLHRGVVETAWRLSDDVEHVGYAHTVDEAVSAAREAQGVAVLLRATPADAVASVAAAGARMPRKSTLFTPKPASGLFLRRLADHDVTT